jgi:hypothetical protein
MTKYLNQIGGVEILAYIVLIVAIAMMMCVFIGLKMKGLRLEKKKYIIYTFVQGVVFILYAAILYNLKGTTLQTRFISLQAYMLVAGTMHLIAYHLYFKKFEAKETYKELAIAIISGVFMVAFIVMVAAHFHELDYVFYTTGSAIVFVIPTFCYILFETAVSIPAKLHKRWFYPVNSRYPAPQISDMRNVIILNFIFQKKANEKQIINFKVKAPRAFEFGKLFYYFINDYNEKNPNSKIHYFDEKNEPYGWYFYTKPKWFGTSEYIDPEFAIDTNNIKDGETIICQRI